MHFIGYHQMLYHTHVSIFFLSRFLKVKLDEKKMSNSLLISLYHINKIGQKMFFFLNSISILALVPCPLFCQLEHLIGCHKILYEISATGVADILTPIDMVANY